MVKRTQRSFLTTRVSARRGWLAALACLALVACLACGGGASDQPLAADSAPVPAADPAPALEVVEPRVQLMPGMGAVYLRVVNSGDAPDRLLAVETPIADITETHESVEEDGVVRMVAHPDGFEIPAGGTVELAPGGKHVMLIEPRTPEVGADTVPLILRFESSQTIEVTASVAGLDAMAESMPGHEDHHEMNH